MTFIVREAGIGDAAECIRFVQRAGNEPSISIGLQPGEFNMTIEEEEAFIGKHIGSKNHLMLVAEADDRIIGVITLEGRRSLSARHVAELGIMVDQDWRGRGVGTQLIQRALDWAHQNKTLKRLELRVFVRNTGALRLYERFGFVIEGRQCQAIYREGEYHDDYGMALIL